MYIAQKVDLVRELYKKQMKLIFSQTYESFCLKEASFQSGHWRSKSFNDCFKNLPKIIQQKAYTDFEHMLSNPQQVGLKSLYKAHDYYQVYSAQVGNGYRTLGIKVQNFYIWYWIGTHEEYNREKGKQPPSSALVLAQNVLRNKGKQ